MFEGFAHVWSPVALARRLRKEPLAVRLAGERVVLFRDARGTPAALLDRCPHRGVQLSLGRLTESGCLECPFHAWQFNARGEACHIPLNPDAKRERLFATPLPVRELGGMLWVYTAAGTRAPAEPVLPDTLTRTGLARTHLEVEWNAHWTRAMENMLDSPHVPFLHAKTIGRFMRPYLRPDSRMDIHWEATSYGARTWAVLEGREAHDAGTLDFYRPNLMALNIPIPGKTFCIHAYAVPRTERTVSMLIIGARSFATWRLLNPFFNRTNRRIAHEDRAVVESSEPAETPEAAEERSVRTDRATLQFRRYYFEVLKPSSAATDPGSEPRPVSPEQPLRVEG